MYQYELGFIDISITEAERDSTPILGGFSMESSEFPQRRPQAPSIREQVEGVPLCNREFASFVCIL